MQVHGRRHAAGSHTGHQQVSSATLSQRFMLCAYYLHGPQEGCVSIPFALPLVDTGENSVTKGHSLGCVLSQRQS